MNLFAKHNNMFALGLAILFFLASAGFTAVLHYCRDEEGDGDPVREMAADAPSKAESIGMPGDDCCQTSMVGGLNDTQAPFQGSQTTALSRIASLQHRRPTAVLLTSVTHYSVLSFLFHERILHPQLEKYVLNGVFLI